MSMDIGELKLTMDTEAALRAAGINTVADLIRIGFDKTCEVEGVRRVGVKAAFSEIDVRLNPVVRELARKKLPPTMMMASGANDIPDDAEVIHISGGHYVQAWIWVGDEELE